MSRSVRSTAMPAPPTPSIRRMSRSASCSLTRQRSPWPTCAPTPRNTAVGLVIGDVAGHGAAAAAIMGQLRTAWRAYTVDGHPPAGIIERLHRLLATVEPEVLATCCCVVADPSSGLVRWASAGHLDPLVRAPDHTTAFLDGGRTVPLGVPFDGSGDPIPEGQATLAPGSLLLLLYTD